MDYSRKVVVIGESHYNTLGLLRSLGQKAIRPYLLLVGTSGFIKKCKYIKEVKVVGDYTQIKKELFAWFIDEIQKPALYCCNDDAIAEIDRNYNEYSKKFICFNAKEQGRINLFLDKNRMRALAKECGLNVPETWEFEYSQEIPADMQYPCIIKAKSSIIAGKTAMKICHDEKSLREWVQPGISYIVQKYYEKDYELNFLGLSIKHGKEIFYPGVVKKIRHWPPTIGASSFAVLKTIEGFNINISAIQKFIQAIEYEGLFSIEFVAKDGLNYFLEVNLRNDGLTHISTVAGLNLPYMWYEYINNNGLVACDAMSINETYYMHDATDYNHIKNGQIKLQQWYGDFKRARAKAMWDSKDPAPMLDFIFTIVKSKTKSVLHKALKIKYINKGGGKS